MTWNLLGWHKIFTEDLFPTLINSGVQGTGEIHLLTVASFQLREAGVSAEGFFSVAEAIAYRSICLRNMCWRYRNGASSWPEFGEMGENFIAN